MLFNKLVLIPSRYKKKVANNSGYYSLGKAVFIRAILKENEDKNLFFTDIKGIWLCDADPKYDDIFNVDKDS